MYYCYCTSSNVLLLMWSNFDPTTQMSYIPLDKESKIKGKAAIEVLGSRIGKIGGSLIQQGLVLIFGNIVNLLMF